MSDKHPTRFYFFLSPYPDMAFMRCPKCEGKTKQRKLPLVIHIEPNTLCALNKTCRVCPACELLIARQSQIDSLLTQMAVAPQSVIEEHKYLIVGTLDRKDWLVGQEGHWPAHEAVERIWLFKNHWDFEIRGGWMAAEDVQPR